MSTCPGCGLVLPDTPGYPKPRFNATPACWRLFGELTAQTLLLPRTEFIHQTAVDCYEAQHAGGSAKPLSTVFGLVGLYLVLERGYTGREVQRAHKLLAKYKHTLPDITLPDFRGDITVQSVLSSGDKISLLPSIHLWAQSVWSAYAAEQDKIRFFVKEHLYLKLRRDGPTFS